MTSKEKAKEIMSRYDRNFSRLQKEATTKDLKTVFKYIADESKRKQGELVGLDKTNVKS